MKAVGLRPESGLGCLLCAEFIRKWFMCQIRSKKFVQEGRLGRVEIMSWHVGSVAMEYAVQGEVVGFLCLGYRFKGAGWGVEGSGLRIWVEG